MEILDFLVVKFSLISDVVWSGVIASVLTLSGVLISNSSNTKRLRIQLEHDGIQRDIDRKATIRKSVYLEIAEASINASTYIGTIANVEPTNISSGLNMYYVAAAKVMVVADMNTTLAVNKLSNELSILVLETVPQLMQIAKDRSMDNMYKLQYEDLQTEIKRILAAQRNFNELPTPKDFAVYETLKQSFQHQQNFSDQIAAKQRDYSHKVATAKIDFLQYLVPKLTDLSDLVTNILISIRHEVGITSDIEVLLSQQKLFKIEQSAKLEVFIDYLKNELKMLEAL